MKKVMLLALAAAFVAGIGASTLIASHAYAGDEPMVDCSNPDNADNEACK